MSIGLTNHHLARADSPLIETRDPRAIVDELINGLPLARVPRDLHPSLLVPLSAAKTENLVAGRADTVRKLQSLIRDLDISVVKPDPIRRRTGPRATTPLPKKLPLLSTMRQASEQKFRVELAACEEYWNDEIKRYDEMRQDAVDAVSRRFDAQVAEVESAPAPRHVQKPSPALQQLREKHDALGETARNDEERARIQGRMGVVEQLDQKEQHRRDVENTREKIARLRAEEETEKQQLQMEWDEKWRQLIRERRQDLAKKRMQVRSVLSKTLPAGRLTGLPKPNK